MKVPHTMIQSFKITLLFFSCTLALHSYGQSNSGKQVDEGYIKDNVYKSKAIGWSIEIPKGWHIVSNDESKATDEKGKEAIEQSTGMQVDVSGLKHLISFQKDMFNLFTSSSEPFNEAYPGEYEDNNARVNELIYQTLVGQGIKCDSSSGKAIIQGLEFQTYRSTIYAPTGEVILYQVMYSRLINGYDFSVNINYNNEADKQTMLQAWEKSIFTTTSNGAKKIK